MLVDNYMILYGSENKDKHSLKDFVLRFRKTLKRPSNITIIDDIRAKEILLNYKPRNEMSQYEKIYKLIIGLDTLLLMPQN